MKISFAIFVCMASMPHLYGQSDYEKALILAEKHGYSVERIQNYGCDISLYTSDLVGASPTTKEYFGTYLRDLNTERFFTKKEEDAWTIYFSKDGILKTLSSKTATTNLAKTLGKSIEKGEVYITGAIEKTRNPILFMCDINERAFLKLKSPEYSGEGSFPPSITLVNLLKSQKRKFESIKKNKEGNDVLVVSLKGRDNILYLHEYTLNPRLNHLITSFVSYKEKVDDSAIVAKTELSNFFNHGDGIFFPREIVFEIYLQGAVRRREVMKIDNLLVNSREVSEKLFFQFPPDIQVSDLITNTVFQSGPNGSLKEIGKYKPPQYPPDLKQPTAPFAYAVSEESSFSWPLIFAATGGFLFTLSIAIFGIRVVKARFKK